MRLKAAQPTSRADWLDRRHFLLGLTSALV
jgi:hypothetical protein